MKKFLLAFIIPAFTILSACNNKPGNGGAITLKFNLPVGSSYNYNIEVSMQMNGNINGQALNMNNKMAMGYGFTAAGDSAGWKKLNATIENISMHISGNGVNINYDSNQPADTSDVVSATVGKVLGALKGGQFQFTMNDSGQVGSISGIQDMMQRIMSSINIPGASAMVSGIGSTFNDENFKQNIQQSFGMYPNKPVKPGDTWQNTTEMNNQGMILKLDNTYTLQSVDGNNANVKVDSKISSQGAMSINGTMSGTMKFDVPTGLPLDGNLDMNMNMGEANSQSAPLKMDMKTKITGKKA